MRVLLDTNIVLDYLGANQGFTEDADKVFDLTAKRKDIKLVSSSAITDILSGEGQAYLDGGTGDQGAGPRRHDHGLRSADVLRK